MNALPHLLLASGRSGLTLRSTFLNLIVCATLTSSFATAASFSFSGKLANYSSVQLINFTLAATSTVTVNTNSYAGGLNAAGVNVVSGGFDPVISLFNGSGLLIATNDSGPASKADPVTKESDDVNFQSSLAAGKYTIALAQFDNFGVGPSFANGFLETSPTFTSAFGCTAGSFCDIYGYNRTANWEIDVLNVSAASLPGTASPEPAIPGMVALGLIGLGVFRARRMSRS